MVHRGQTRTVVLAEDCDPAEMRDLFAALFLQASDVDAGVTPVGLLLPQSDVLVSLELASRTVVQLSGMDQPLRLLVSLPGDAIGILAAASYGGSPALPAAAGAGACV